MSVADRWIITLEQSAVGGANPAQFGIETDPTNGVANDDAAAQIIAYTVLAMNNMAQRDVKIKSLRFGAAGTTSTVPVPYPAAPYAALVAANVELNPGDGTYPGLTLGIAMGGLAPIGTSIVMREQTLTPGRAGMGRHFLPFVNKAVVDGDGLVDNALQAALVNIYETYILDGTMGADPLLPVVEPQSGGTAKLITSVAVASVFSNLRSRRY